MIETLITLITKFNLTGIEIKDFPGMIFYKPIEKAPTRGFLLSLYKPTNEIKIASMVWADTTGIQFGYWTDIIPGQFEPQLKYLCDEYERAVIGYKLKIVDLKKNEFAKDFS